MSVLRRIRVENFRSIRGAVDLDLDAPIVLLHALNGYGKTSLVSAIELALTGRVRSLESAAGERTGPLQHFQSKQGRVDLSAQFANRKRSTSIGVSQDEVEGLPLLSEEASRNFAERSLLVQTSLGRFLDDSAPNGEAAESSPLVSFVKEMLGLDALDALVEALEPAGDTRNARKLSSNWVATKARVDELDRQLSDLAKERRRIERARLRVVERIRGEADLFLSTDPLSDARGILSQDPTELSFDQISARVRALRLQQTSVEHALDDLDALTARRRDSTQAFESRWEAERPFVLQALERASQSGYTIVSLDVPEVLDEVDRVLELVKKGLAENERQEAESRQVADRVARLQSEEAAEIARRVGIRDEIDTLSSQVRGHGLESALREIEASLNDNQCPVCDQNFEGDLAAHVAAKLDSLSIAGRALDRLIQDERDTTEYLGHLANRISDARLELARFPNRDVSKENAEELRSLAGHLRRVVRLSRILRDLDKRARQAIALENAARESSVARIAFLKELENLEVELGVSEEQSSIDDRLSRFEGELAQRVRSHLGVSERRRTIRDLLVQHDDHSVRIGAIDADIAARQELRLKFQRAIDLAESRKVGARDLRNAAISIRSSTINRVFDETLNRTWQDLFRRLAPDETFVPRFSKQKQSSRSVGVALATSGPDGVEAGSPTSMLSFGNANTAALTLFLALHFASESALPLLVLDDPVQSMDDLHVSNFAALIRRIAVDEGRQVIIAVHERALFDYLKLELAPRTSSEKLHAYSLDRESGSTVAVLETTLFASDDTIASRYLA